jgi:hypothetical protein
MNMLDLKEKSLCLVGILNSHFGNLNIGNWELKCLFSIGNSTFFRIVVI